MEILVKLLQDKRDVDEKQNLGYFYPQANKSFRIIHCF